MTHPALIERITRSLAYMLRHQPGEFDYYALVLSWSPTHCASTDRNDSDPQCSRRDGRRYLGVVTAGPFAEPDGLKGDSPLLKAVATHGGVAASDPPRPHPDAA